MSVACLVRGYRPLIALASPIAGIQLAQVALTTTDLFITGALGVKAIVAGGLAIMLYNQLHTMCVGAVTAVGNLVAGAAGQGGDALGRSAARRTYRERGPPDGACSGRGANESAHRNHPSC
jgi:MATE family multidrug resistance protein